VEVKQPELQIARSYTPLPANETEFEGDIRLLVRKEHKGEMSGYIFNLPIQSKMQLRGRHPEFDIPEEVSDIIFLAGGTGIAPALQTVHTLLERRFEDHYELPKVHIIWSNRRREDCVGGKDFPEADAQDQLGVGPIVRELERFRRLYPKSVTVEYLVDEERSFINDKRIARWTNEKNQSDESSADSRLIMVSGPEGFVNRVSGPKRWQDGKEYQGEIGGILGQMNINRWKVRKL